MFSSRAKNVTVDFDMLCMCVRQYLLYFQLVVKIYSDTG